MGASGSTTLNFGASPGKVEVTADVVAAGVLTTSLVEAWLLPIATADHNVEEHLIERMSVRADVPSAGTIRIRGSSDGFDMALHDVDSDGGQVVQKFLYTGLYTVGWVWN